MSVAILVFQQIFYDKSLLLSVFIGAVIYILLIRILKTLDHEDFELLRQVTGKRLANYTKKILGYPSTPT